VSLNEPVTRAPTDDGMVRKKQGFDFQDFQKLTTTCTVSLANYAEKYLHRQPANGSKRRALQSVRIFHKSFV
jgi:hypothetical protein